MVDVSDVGLFFAVYDAAGGKPDARTLDTDYLAAGTDGLRTLARLRNVTGESMSAAIRTQPELYEHARSCAASLPAVTARLDSALERLATYLPDAHFPPATIAVGRGRPVGVGGPGNGVQIGLEALCAADFLNPDIEDRFVYVITHEYIHVQQSPELAEGESLTVLEASLMEGIAEFLCELTSGGTAYGQFADLVRDREFEIETRFANAIDSRDLSDWMYNSGKAEIPDLGYWVGYRIAKAYYQSAPDKPDAVRKMLAMTDARKFLAESGWAPGIKLAE